MIFYSCSNKIIKKANILPPPISNTIDNMPTTASKTWNFDNLNEWEDATQSGLANYFIENGLLNMFTNPNTWERVKIKSVASYATGIYTWRIYVPAIGEGDCTGIGAFLYHNDKHEIDFEIGYGKQTERTALNATDDELLIYMTSQGNPHHSFQSKIKRENWYTLTIELALNANKKYVATWKIDNIAFTSAVLNYGPKTKFKIFCSVENLSFIADHIPYSKNYAVFDWVAFSKN